jgi:hypothetical protein
MTMQQIVCEAALIYFACGLAVTLACGVPLDIIDAFCRICIRHKGHLPEKGGPEQMLGFWLAVVMWPKAFWRLACGIGEW